MGGVASSGSKSLDTAPKAALAMGPSSGELRTCVCIAASARARSAPWRMASRSPCIPYWCFVGYEGSLPNPASHPAVLP